MPASAWPMRIALVAPPMLPVPPRAYAGTERVIDVLARELHRRGHAVTLFASGDSKVECELVPTVDRALWDGPGYVEELDPFFQIAQARVWREAERFDVIHSHLEGFGFAFARHCPTPVVTTMHGRLDLPGIPELLAEFPEIPLVAISRNQRRWHPGANWVATVHHGLPLEPVPHSDRPGDYLALVGRLSHEKGVAEAIRLARETGMRLRVAAKQRLPEERALYRDILEPAVREGIAEYLGEVGAAQRDELYAGAYATLMLGAWPEPFGLVAIESMGAGTPVIARKAGALTEIVEHGVDGFLVDDLGEAALAFRRVPELDRQRIRERALVRFSPQRMVDAYERVYRHVIEEAAQRRTRGRSRPVVAVPLVAGDGAGSLSGIDPAGRPSSFGEPDDRAANGSSDRLPFAPTPVRGLDGLTGPGCGPGSGAGRLAGLPAVEIGPGGSGRIRESAPGRGPKDERTGNGGGDERT